MSGSEVGLPLLLCLCLTLCACQRSLVHPVLDVRAMEHRAYRALQHVFTDQALADPLSQLSFSFRGIPRRLQPAASRLGVLLVNETFECSTSKDTCPAAQEYNHPIPVADSGSYASHSAGFSANETQPQPSDLSAASVPSVAPRPISPTTSEASCTTSRPLGVSALDSVFETDLACLHHYVNISGPAGWRTRPLQCADVPSLGGAGWDMLGACDADPRLVSLHCDYACRGRRVVQRCILHFDPARHYGLGREGVRGCLWRHTDCLGPGRQRNQILCYGEEGIIAPHVVQALPAAARPAARNRTVDPPPSTAASANATTLAEQPLDPPAPPDVPVEASMGSISANPMQAAATPTARRSPLPDRPAESRVELAVDRAPDVVLEANAPEFLRSQREVAVWGMGVAMGSLGTALVLFIAWAGWCVTSGRLAKHVRQSAVQAEQRSQRQLPRVYDPTAVDAPDLMRLGAAGALPTEATRAAMAAEVFSRGPRGHVLLQDESEGGSVHGPVEEVEGEAATQAGSAVAGSSDGGDTSPTGSSRVPPTSVSGYSRDSDAVSLPSEAPFLRA